MIWVSYSDWLKLNREDEAENEAKDEVKMRSRKG